MRGKFEKGVRNGKEYEEGEKKIDVETNEE